MEKLKNNAHVAAAPLCYLTLVETMHRCVTHQYLTRGGAVDAGNHVNQSRFTAAGLADDRDELAGIDSQTHVVECHKDSGFTLVSFYHPAQLNQVIVTMLIAAVGGIIVFLVSFEPPLKHKRLR